MRAKHQAIYEYLVPVVKGWSTEMVNEVASLGIQVHGGMGFIEETGAAQYYRDARILAIYEGTTAIQANDLVGRKTARDGGAVAKALIGEIRQTAEALGAHDGPAFTAMKTQLENGARALSAVVDFVVANVKGDPNAVFAGSVPYLKLAGVVLCGWQMARALLVAQQKRADDPRFYDAKIALAQFYAEHILAQAGGLACEMKLGRERIESMALRAFALEQTGADGRALLAEAMNLARTFHLTRTLADAHPAVADWARRALDPACLARAGRRCR